MATFSPLFLAGFYSEGSKSVIIEAIKAAGQDAKAQEAVRAEVRRGVFAKAFLVKCDRSGLPTVASVNATDAILEKQPSQLTEEEKVVHARFRKEWSRRLADAGEESTDPRTKGNKNKNKGKGKKKPGPKVTTTNEEKTEPTPTVVAPVAPTMAEIEAYALQMATTFDHYVKKNGKVFAGEKGHALREAFRQFTRAARAAALIQEDGEKKAA